MKKPFSLLGLLTFTLFTSIAIAQNGTKYFEFDDFFKNNTFSTRGYRPGRPMNDGSSYVMAEAKGTRLVRYSYATGTANKVLLDLAAIPGSPIQSFTDFAFSPDETRILLTTNRQAIYRRSFTAEFYVADLASQTIKPLSASPKQRLATFSPDGTKVAFVRENNLFYADLIRGKEIQVTTDGRFNAVINGAPDWVYEEEFEFNQASEWSPDSKYLAWIRFDESDVPLFCMALYQGSEPSMDEYSLYPGISTFKYPKAGESNSLVTVHTFNLQSRKKKTMDIGPETDIYIPRIRWTKDPGKLAIFRQNRHQDHFEILIADPASGHSNVLYSEQNPFYIDESSYDAVKFLDDRQHFTILSERDGWAHVYIYNMDGTLLSRVTGGDFDVLALNGVDAVNRKVYYTSAEPLPYNRTVWAVNWDGTGKTKLSEKEGVNSATFSRDFSYCTITWSDANTPPRTSLYKGNGEFVRVLDDNSKLAGKLSEYKYNQKEFFSFITSEGVTLYGWMIRPPDFDSSKKYPVLLTQYSGPNSQSVLNRWELDWENYLAQLGYLVICVDGRGTGGRGEAFRKVTQLQLGKYETIDQVETAKYAGKLPFADASRIGIWGWSFGGYISSSCMVKGNGIFKAAIAVAPVTNWRYYDNIYTERFMHTPLENPDGYDQNSPLFFAGNLKGKLLLCHGSADDNVHVQNTMEFAERLVQANKQFEMQIYTNRNHGIYGGNTTYHLYTRMTEFLKENL